MEKITLVDVNGQNEANTNLTDFHEIVGTYQGLGIQNNMCYQLILKTISNIRVIRQKTKNVFEEKTGFEEEISKKETKKKLLQDNLCSSKEIIGRERLKNKICQRENQKMKESIDSVMNSLPANHVNEIISKVKEQQLKICSNGFSSSGSISPTSESYISSSSLFLSSTGMVSNLIPHEPSKGNLMFHHTRSLNEISKPSSNGPGSQNYIADAEEFSFSGRISSSTESDRSSILVFPTIMDSIKSHQHLLKNRFFVMGNKCNVCHDKMCCGVKGYNCDACHAAVHERCRDFLSLPCIPMNKVRRDEGSNLIENYSCPSFRPQIPAIVIHCVMEIEKRGLDQIGLYRVPEYDRRFENFMQWCLQGTGIPNLNKVKINLVCELLKHFLRLINPPLITEKEFQLMQKSFESTTINDHAIIYNALFNMSSNCRRCTLIFIILHLQKIAESQACKMSPRSLSKTFTPILVENYKNDTYADEKKNCKLLECFIKIGSIQWQSVFIKFIEYLNH